MKWFWLWPFRFDSYISLISRLLPFVRTHSRRFNLLNIFPLFSWSFILWSLNACTKSLWKISRLEIAASNNKTKFVFLYFGILCDMQAEEHFLVNKFRNSRIKNSLSKSKKIGREALMFKHATMLYKLIVCWTYEVITWANIYWIIDIAQKHMWQTLLISKWRCLSIKLIHQFMSIHEVNCNVKITGNIFSVRYKRQQNKKLYINFYKEKLYIRFIFLRIWLIITKHQRHFETFPEYIYKLSCESHSFAYKF